MLKTVSVASSSNYTPASAHSPPPQFEMGPSYSYETPYKKDAYDNDQMFKSFALIVGQQIEANLKL